MSRVINIDRTPEGRLVQIVGSDVIHDGKRLTLIKSPEPVFIVTDDGQRLQLNSIDGRYYIPASVLHDRVTQFACWIGNKVFSLFLDESNWITDAEFDTYKYTDYLEPYTGPFAGTVLEQLIASPDTINSIIAKAPAGSIIYLDAGVYGILSFTRAVAENLTLVGEAGTSVSTVRLVETENYGAPKGLTLKNIVLNGEGITASGKGGAIDKLSVIGCTFNNGAVIHINGDSPVDGLTVQDCVFEATNSEVNAKEKTAILLQGDNINTVIKGNTIKDSEHNAIQILKIKGSFNIEDNNISGSGSRAIRLTTQEGADLTIANNIISNVNTNPAEATENNGEIIKITGPVLNGNFSNNIYEGSELVDAEGLFTVE